MSEPFLAEIRIVSFNFPPKGWAHCHGQLLPINQNQALFSLLGTTYGGNGQTTFALPDLRGRTPIHTGNGHVLGERAGTESQTLTLNALPAHTHGVFGNATTADADRGSPASNAPAYTTEERYSATGPPVLLHAQAITSGAGGGQPHSNLQPFLTLSFIIALQGIFPSRN
jgi:microcystin-dependent protein